jgi:hypothetical protein
MQQLHQTKVSRPVVLTALVSDAHDNVDLFTHRALPQRDQSNSCAVSSFAYTSNRRHLRHDTQSEPTPFIQNQPTLLSIGAAGISFSSGNYTIEVPSDPHLPMIFEDDEMSIGLRAFSYGHNFPTLQHPVVFLMNAVKAPDKQQQKSVPKYSENIELNHRTMNRMHYFCEMLHIIIIIIVRNYHEGCHKVWFGTDLLD